MKNIWINSICLLMIGLMYSSCSSFQEKTPQVNSDSSSNSLQGTFTHSVYFWLANPDSEEDKAEFEAAVKKFIDNSAYVKTKYLGTPAGTPREVVDNSWTYNLIVTFDSKEDHDLYQAEQVHEDFRNGSAHLWTKVLIYDGVKVW
jgi:hypothetical protein